MFKMSSGPLLGAQNFDLNSIDVVAKCPVGTIVRAVDDGGVLGDAEFIYLPGVAALVAGDCVVYSLAVVPSVVRTSSATHVNKGRPVAFALLAIPAGSYGWYQIGGLAVVNALAAAADAVVMVSATAGSVSSGVIAGAQIIGAVFTGALGVPSAGKAYCAIQRPCLQSQIT